MRGNWETGGGGARSFQTKPQYAHAHGVFWLALRNVAGASGENVF